MNCALAPTLEGKKLIVGSRLEDLVYSLSISDKPSGIVPPAKSVPLKRVGVTADIAEVALFLATGADYMTGAVIVVDGGRHLT